MRSRLSVLTVIVALAASWAGSARAAQIVDQTANNPVFGTNAADTINATNDNHRMFGKRGSDRIGVIGANTSIDPGAGADQIHASAQGTTVYDDDGSRDTLFGNDGTDGLIAANGVADRIHCGGGDDVVIADRIDKIGSDCELVVTGTVNQGTNSLIFGSNGADTLTAAGPTDTLFGRKGNDTLNGGTGTNFLLGGPGVDQLNGVGGSDTLIDDDGTPGDHLDGGAGGDTFLAADGAIDTIDCGAADGATDVVYADTNDNLVNCTADTQHLG